MNQVNKNGRSGAEALPAESKKNVSKSIMGQIAVSASGLVGNSFLRPSPNAAISSLASIAGYGNKGGSASASSGPSGLGSSPGFRSSQCFSIHDVQHDHHHIAELQPSWPRNYNSLSNGGQFCFEECVSGHEDFHLQPDRSRYASTDTQFDHSYHELSNPSVKDRLKYSLEHPKSQSIRTQDTIRPPASVCVDGAAVVALLSDPEFSPVGDLECLAMLPTGQIGEINDTKPPMHPLVDLHEKQAAFLLDNMPQHFHIGFKYPSTSTNDISREENRRESDSYGQGADGSILRSWLHNLKTYQDEIWGYISPTTRRAGAKEKETAEAGSNEALRNQSAIKRLTMILAHINPTTKWR